MHISIRKYKTDNAPEVARRVNERFRELIGELPGFRGFFVIDTGDGAIASINLFETIEGVEESNKVGVAWAKKELKDVVGGPPEILMGKVVVEKTK